MLHFLHNFYLSFDWFSSVRIKKLVLFVNLQSHFPVRWFVKSDTNNSISSLSDLFPNNIVLKRRFGRKAHTIIIQIGLLFTGILLLIILFLFFSFYDGIFLSNWIWYFLLNYSRCYGFSRDLHNRALMNLFFNYSLFLDLNSRSCCYFSFPSILDIHHYTCLHVLVNIFFLSFIFLTILCSYLRLWLILIS